MSRRKVTQKGSLLIFSLPFLCFFFSTCIPRVYVFPRLFQAKVLQRFSSFSLTRLMVLTTARKDALTRYSAYRFFTDSKASEKERQRERERERERERPQTNDPGACGFCRHSTAFPFNWILLLLNDAALNQRLLRLRYNIALFSPIVLNKPRTYIVNIFSIL